jgi:putative DNA primase/helicase
VNWTQPFRAADHVAFKAFISREFDELRMPYAAKSSRFRRRTVFFGSVNDPAFLKDKTGGRRFYPLSVDRGFPAWADAEVDQLWAQAWSLYADGEQWWPTSDEDKLLGVNAELFREKSWVEEDLEEKFTWGLPPSDEPRQTATAVLRELKGR